MTARGWLWKAATQLLFDFTRRPVANPGSRGGRYFRTNRGDVRYGVPAPTPAPVVGQMHTADADLAKKLRALADKAQAQAADRRNPGVAHQNLTHRRAGQIASAHQQAERFEQLERALRALADQHEAGTVDPALRGIRSRQQLEDILDGRVVPTPFMHASFVRDLAQASYADLDHETHLLAQVFARVSEGDHRSLLTPAEIEAAEKVAKRLDADPDVKSWQRVGAHAFTWIKEWKRAQAAGLATPEAWAAAKEAVAALHGPRVERPEDRIRKLEHAIIGRQFPGYFPTSRAASELAVSAADVEAGMHVLEPSAGKGDMADAIRRACPDCQVTTIEMQSELGSILEAKGYTVAGRDMFQHQGQYDRIIMNPPFEGGQDIDHVRYAYEHLLKPGGRLVSIMSEGPFFRGDKKATEFRAWLAAHDGEAEKLPDGSFKIHESSDRTTGVSTRLAVLDKPVPRVSEVEHASQAAAHLRAALEDPAVQAARVAAGEPGANLGGSPAERAAAAERAAKRRAEWRVRNATPLDAQIGAFAIIRQREAELARWSTHPAEAQRIHSELSAMRAAYERGWEEHPELSDQRARVEAMSPSIPAKPLHGKTPDQMTAEAREDAAQGMLGKARVGWFRVGAWLKSQLGFAFPATPVQHPGIHGGRYRVTPTGDIRYDDAPAPQVVHNETIDGVPTLVRTGSPDDPFKYRSAFHVTMSLDAAGYPAETRVIHAASLEDYRRQLATRPLSPEEDYRQKGTRARAFKAWFGDWEADPADASKVLNAQGEPAETFPVPPTELGDFALGGPSAPVPPKVVYHGSPNTDFHIFDPRKADPHALYGPGFYFTEDEGVARGYATAQHEVWLEDVALKRLATFVRRHFPPAADHEVWELQRHASMVWGLGMAPNRRDVRYYLRHSTERGLNADHEIVLTSRMGGAAARHDHIPGLLKWDAATTQAWKRLAQSVGWGEPPLGDVKACYLNIRRPFDADTDTVRWGDAARIMASATIAGEAPTGKPDDERLDYHFLGSRLRSKRAATDVLKRLGYDGLTHIGGNITGGRNHRVWIAFDAHQIKAVDNEGTFNPNDFDIFKSVAELATTHAELTKDLFYLEEEDLPAAVGDDFRRGVLVKARAAMIGELADVDAALTKARRLHYRTQVGDLPVSIENRVGSYRHWKNPDDGSEGRTKVKHAYGYIRGTVGLDDEAVDLFLGPHARDAQALARSTVYVVHTRKAPDFTELDEQKVMVGFSSADAAKRAFLQHYNDPRFFGQMDAIPYAEFADHLAATKHGDPMLRGNVVARGAPTSRGARLRFGKAHIGEYTRTSPAGTPVTVHEHEDLRTPAQAQAGTGRPLPLRFAAGPKPPAMPKIPSAPKGPLAPVQASAPAGAEMTPGGLHGYALHELAAHIDSYRPILSKALDSLEQAFPGVPIAGRLKETTSLQGKLDGKLAARGQGLEAVEDIAGARVTLGSHAEQLAAVERIRRSFKVRSEDDYINRPKAAYRSYHFVVDVDGRPVELQLRTERQTRWADFSHDTAYKTHGKATPPELHAYLAAMGDHYGCLDGGGAAGECGQAPECPPQVRTLYGCLDAS